MERLSKQQTENKNVQAQDSKSSDYKVFFKYIVSDKIIFQTIIMIVLGITTQTQFEKRSFEVAVLLRLRLCVRIFEMLKGWEDVHRKKSVMCSGLIRSRYRFLSRPKSLNYDTELASITISSAGRWPSNSSICSRLSSSF
jgi:hypothetical protein